MPFSDQLPVDPTVHARDAADVSEETSFGVNTPNPGRHTSRRVTQDVFAETSAGATHPDPCRDATGRRRQPMDFGAYDELLERIGRAMHAKTNGASVDPRYHPDRPRPSLDRA